MTKRSEILETEAARLSPQTTPGLAAIGDELFRLLVSSVLDYAIFALDPTGHILTWNAGAERFKGYRADEVIGKHFSIFYTEEDCANGRPSAELADAIERGRVEDEGWRVRKDGSLFWANVVITALRNRDGQLIGFAKVTRDLTERRDAEQRSLRDARRIAAEEAARELAEQRARELEDLTIRLRTQSEELEQRRQEAESASRTKSQFLANMSHELRTPLNAIAGYTDLLLAEIHGPLTPLQRRDLERIQRSEQHLLTLINDVLSYTRIERGNVTYNVRNTKICAVIEHAVELLEPQAIARGIDLVAEGGTEAVVLADRERLAQILVNLIGNAIKFTDRGGRITVTSNIADRYVDIDVMDTGRGIPADQLEEIFEPFMQFDSGFTRSAEGVGLGLAISRDLAHAMGGSVLVKSEVGVGSTFTLRLRRGRDAT